MQWKLRALVPAGLALAGIWVGGCNKQPAFTVMGQNDGFGQQVAYSNKIDVLWVMDSSESMVAHKQNIIDQAGSFIDVLVEKGLDVHIGITTSRMGSGGEQGQLIGNPKVLTNATPNLREAFQANIQAYQNVTSLVRSLESSTAALSSPLKNGANSGFLRDDAFLAIIYVSDEDDKSGSTTDSWISQLDQAKPAFAYSRSWAVNYIGIISNDPACTTNGQVSYPGLRFLDVVSKTNGVSQSICTNDLSKALTNIRQFIVSMITAYRLTATPDVATIQVFINGQKVPNDTLNGWTYDAASNSVWLHGSYIPKENSSVQVTYSLGKAK